MSVRDEAGNGLQANRGAVDPLYGDTLMHISGNLLKEDVRTQLKPFVKVRYFIPGKR